MEKHEVDDLVGNSFYVAVENVVTVINRCVGREVLTKKDTNKAEHIAKKLGVMFYENGEIAL